MKKEDEPLDDGKRLGARDALDESTRFVAAFSRTSAIALAVYDSQLRFRVVNNAAAAVIRPAPEAFVGNTLRDMIGDAALESDARFQRVLVAGETPPVEVSGMVPSRTKLGHWIEKQFTIKNAAGRVTQVAALAVEVTGNRELEERLRKLNGELLWGNEGYQRLARELHDSINEYHAALGVSLDRLSRCTRDPERIPERLRQSMEFLDERMRKLASAVTRCFPREQH